MPLARSTDPGTSHTAAASAERGASTCRERVLAVLRAHPSGMTHQELVRELTRQAYYHGWPSYTDSGIRTRCKELQDRGLVTAVEGRYGRTSSGRKSLYWRALGASEIGRPQPEPEAEPSLDLGL